MLVYPSARLAEHEGRRVREGVGATPLAERPGGAAPVAPVVYFVAGPLVVRHRGAAPEVRARLEAALGDPVGGGPQVAGAPEFPSVPESPSLAYYRYDVGPLGATLYQGKDVPSWSVDPAAVSGPYGAMYRALYYGD